MPHPYFFLTSILLQQLVEFILNSLQKLSMQSQWDAILRERFDHKRGIMNLDGMDIQANGLAKLLYASRGTQNLIRLNLSKRCNKIKVEGAKCLAAANFPNLTLLNLWNNNIGDEGIKFLALAQFPNLVKLYLGKNKIGDEGIKSLTVGNFPNLAELWLSQNCIRAEGAKCLAAANFHNLVKLILGKNKNIHMIIRLKNKTRHTSDCYSNKRIQKMFICDQYFLHNNSLSGRIYNQLKKQSFALSTFLVKCTPRKTQFSTTEKKLNHLFNAFLLLSYNKIFIKLSMDSEWKTIVRQRFDQEKGILKLYKMGVGNKDIPEIIEACKGMKDLTGLYLVSNKIEAEGAKHLSASKFPNLSLLNLDYNNIGSEGTKYLAYAYFPNLTELRIWKNNIGSEGAKYLAYANFANLTKLSIRKNNIGDEGLKHLVSTKLPYVLKLDLCENNIGDEGAKYLSVGNFPNLTELYLWSNNIGAEGAKYLIAANFPKLTKLSLYGHNMKQLIKPQLALLFKQKNLRMVISDL